MQSCHECGADVRDPYSFCPECGEPVSPSAKATAPSSGDGSAGTSTDDGLGRRRLLLYGGAAVGAAAAGSGAGYLLLTGGGGPGDPAETVRSFVEGMDEGDVERVNALLHEDADMQRLNDSGASVMEGVDMSLESTDVLSENATHAEVHTEVSMTLLGETQTSNATIRLATQDGEWRILGGDDLATG